MDLLRFLPSVWLAFKPALAAVPRLKQARWPASGRESSRRALLVARRAARVLRGPRAPEGSSGGRLGAPPAAGTPPRACDVGGGPKVRAAPRRSMGVKHHKRKAAQ